MQPKSKSLRTLAILVALGATGALLTQSVAVRMDDEAEVAEMQSADFAFDEAGVHTFLADLDDDLSDSELQRVRQEILDAVAPYAGSAEEISDPANLIRIETPTSELADLRAALSDEELESFELEGLVSVPDVETEFASAETAGELQAQDGGERFVPNDPYYKHQWHMDLIQMPLAWRRSQGEGAVVAVIDTGVLFRDEGAARQAPDLAGTRFVPGYDFVDNDDVPNDGHGHGTHVAGTIAQSTNNELGVAGVAPRAAIMPIRVLDNRGGGRYGNVAAGIRWAVDNGANVLNLSLGGPIPSAAISNAIRHAHDKGVTVVVAAGNTGRGRVQHPASAPHAFAVGAVRYDETLSFYSSYGRALDIVAPGGDLRVDQNGDGLPDGVLQNTMKPRSPGEHDYLAYQGTSMAAPHVAGVAALLYSAGVTDPDAIERVIQDTAKSKSDRNRYGAGLVQADDALIEATRDRGAMSGLFAALFGVLAFGLRRRRIGLALAAAALAGSGVFGLDLFRLGASALGGGWPLLIGVLLPLAAIGLGFHRKGGRRVAAVLGASVAGWLVVEAASPLLLTWGGVLAGPALVLSALLALGMATVVARHIDA